MDESEYFNYYYRQPVRITKGFYRNRVVQIDGYPVTKSGWFKNKKYALKYAVWIDNNTRYLDESYFEPAKPEAPSEQGKTDGK